MKRRHWLTTLFGILLSAGMGMSHFAEHTPNKIVDQIGGILQTVAAIGLGYSAADKRHTVEK